MSTFDDDTTKEQPGLKPTGPWRATAAPVPPAPRHRFDRFGDSDYDVVEDSPVPLGRGNLRHRVSAARSAAQPPVYVFPRGRGWVRLAVVFAVVCWLVWLAYDLVELGSPGEPIRGLPLAVLVAVVVYWLTRLAGYLVRVTWDRGPRRSTLLPNVVTAVFIALCGTAFLSRTPFAVEPLWDLLWRELWR